MLKFDPTPDYPPLWILNYSTQCDWSTRLWRQWFRFAMQWFYCSELTEKQTHVVESKTKNKQQKHNSSQGFTALLGSLSCSMTGTIVITIEVVIITARRNPKKLFHSVRPSQIWHGDISSNFHMHAMVGRRSFFFMTNTDIQRWFYKAFPSGSNVWQQDKYFSLIDLEDYEIMKIY